jgi:hypothetical protein
MFGPTSDRLHSIRSMVLAVLVACGAAALPGPVANAATAPDTAITSGPSGLIASRKATFSFSSSIAASKFKCKIDTNSWVLCTSPKSYAKLKQGAHTFQVKAKKGTRVDKTAAVRTFTVDSVAPNTTMTDGPTGTTLDLGPEFSFSSSQAGSTFECTVDGSPWNGQWTACTSPWTAGSLYIHQPYTAMVRARDPAGNVDPSPATRTFTIEPINLGGDPYAQAAAQLYFPASVNLDVPASCGTNAVDCPGETPVAPSDQLHMQTSNLSAVYASGASRWDVTATISVASLAPISVQFSGVDCSLTFDSSGGETPTWTATTQLLFTYTLDGDVHITPTSTAVYGMTGDDLVLQGSFVCTIASAYPVSTAQALVTETLEAYWQSVGWPLCEAAAPALVGPCPEE